MGIYEELDSFREPEGIRVFKLVDLLNTNLKEHSCNEVI